MPDNGADNSGQYFDAAVENFRNTTKWIIAASGGLAAFIIGTDPLGRIGPLTGHAWQVAVGALFISLLLTLLMLWFSVEVLAPTGGIDLGPIATNDKYRNLRQYLDRNVLNQYPARIDTVVKLNNECNSQRNRREDTLAHRDQYINAAQDFSEAMERTLQFEKVIKDFDLILGDYKSKRDYVVGIARWQIIGRRFNRLMWYFRVATLVIIACLLVFITTAKPKEKPPTPPPPIAMTLIVNPPSVQINTTTPSPAPSPAAPTETVFDCGDQDQPYRVGPFANGKTDLESGATAVADLVKRLTGGNDRRTLIGLLLIGSTDKTQLSSRSTRQYDTNAGLAQARAEWVRAQLVTSDAFHQLAAAPAGKIAAVIAGPTQLGFDVDPAKLAIDRAVRVCVLWQQQKN